MDSTVVVMMLGGRSIHREDDPIFHEPSSSNYNDVDGVGDEAKFGYFYDWVWQSEVVMVLGVLRGVEVEQTLLLEEQRQYVALS